MKNTGMGKTGHREDCAKLAGSLCGGAFLCRISEGGVCGAGKVHLRVAFTLCSEILYKYWHME